MVVLGVSLYKSVSEFSVESLCQGFFEDPEVVLYLRKVLVFLRLLCWRFYAGLWGSHLAGSSKGSMGWSHLCLTEDSLRICCGGSHCVSAGSPVC